MSGNPLRRSSHIPNPSRNKNGQPDDQWRQEKLGLVQRVAQRSAHRQVVAQERAPVDRRQEAASKVGQLFERQETAIVGGCLWT